jgi:acetyl/propionyl-CoA carboxylase alpha subunit/acetyl-CoA carboxylase carboxyltransferase component
MNGRALLVANRGEIAVRILRAAAEMGIFTTAVYSEDDADSLHIRRADQARPLRGSGVAAYLDREQILAVAKDAGCDAVHPGYGFLSEDAGFARSCRDRGITFVGPRPELLELFGDKAQGRALAERCRVPVLAGSSGAVDVEAATAFLVSLGAGASMMIKAVAGGGGRGLRVVHEPGDVDEAFARCRSEALSAFGNGDVYVEQLLKGARHIEVQIVGDGTGAVSHLGDRDCTIQRRHQKLIEMAPAQWLPADRRAEVLSAAVRMAVEVSYDNIGTFEFLVDASGDSFAFIEANPRLQVEHTVTEEVTGVDLVKAQLALAGGRSLGQLGLLQADVPVPRGVALQVRINMETMTPDGQTRPAGGTLTAFEPPSGPGVRVDTFGYAGYRTNPSFDSLLAKLIARTPEADVGLVAGRAHGALGEFRIEGLATNIGLLRNVLVHPDFLAGRVDTRFVEDHVAELAPALAPAPAGDGRVGASIDPGDPLAVLAHGKSGRVGAPSTVSGAVGAVAVEAPVQGTVVSIDVQEGDVVHAGQQLGVMEAMKMEHVVAAGIGGVIRRVAAAAGDTVYQGHPLLFMEETEVAAAAGGVTEEADLDLVRPDLADVQRRHAVGWDAARPEAIARRRASGQRTARENIADLCDQGSFVEYGPVVIAAQRRRRPVAELIERTPADGLVAGVGQVNGRPCVAMSYDYTVLAGTQGLQNHRKKDRMFELAERSRLPIVIFTEGGGGRPGDTDGVGVAGLDCMAFHLFARLSGLVPLIGIVSGRCFAGNAALLGCCDVVIATENANIGMGGPAMIEGGGLGVFRPDEVGPMQVQVPNGVVDVEVADEAEAVTVAKEYLSYFQGPVATWDCADQRRLRGIIPENRLRIYDVRSVIETMADTRSVLELRRRFGKGMVTALARIEGRPVGVIANNPSHLAGAIDSDGADKATRFMQLCDAFDLPLLFLCDTPGIMVGPEAEKTALVRHCCRMFVTGASLGVPFFTIVLRKGYGLGAQAMAGGSFKAPRFTIAWPTGEFGGMGLEGAAKLGFRNELAAIDDPRERKATFDEMVARMYQHGRAINTASYFEIDDVIDPADSRRWITNALASAERRPPSSAKRRPCIDTW